MAAVKIVQGEDRILKFTISEQDDSGVTTYLNLTGATEIEMRVANLSGTFESFKLTTLEIVITDNEKGMFDVHMSDTKTALLKLGADQSIEIIVDIGAPSAGERRIAQQLKAISVNKRLFS